LHLRLTGVFTIVALVPTILVAVFATITVNMGLEGWFSDRVSTALGNSVDAAVAYQQEHRDDLSQDARALAAFLNVNRRAAPFLNDGELRQLLSQGQSGSSAACARPSSSTAAARSARAANAATCSISNARTMRR
jgi:two-component system nitrogen regulation sensor histidine kinase NtrY